MRWATTSWTQVLAARDAPSSESRQALEALCKAYWYPLYAFIRHQGYDAEESRDLTQAYFAALLEKGYLEDFDPSLGRFRVFLKASVKNFLSKEREKAHAWKRGGRAEVVSVGPVIEQLPMQLWRSPNTPQWGRPFLVRASADMKLLAGERVGIRRL